MDMKSLEKVPKGEPKGEFSKKYYEPLCVHPSTETWCVSHDAAQDTGPHRSAKGEISARAMETRRRGFLYKRPSALSNKLYCCRSSKVAVSQLSQLSSKDKVLLILPIVA